MRRPSFGQRSSRRPERSTDDDLSILVAYPGWMEARASHLPGCRVTSLRPAPPSRVSGRVRLRDCVARADAVVFHLPSTPVSIPVDKAPGQTWVAWSAESDVQYPHQADPAFMAQFDLTVSYRQDADVRLSYCQPRDWLGFRPPSVAAAGREAAPAVYMASAHSDRSGRTDYVRELMRHMPVDSYGRSLNNRRLAADAGIPTKLATIARYRFTLAFENSVAHDYVTEKFYQPLLVGSVPVYLGARNIAEHAPGADCYVNVNDFTDPAELARYLVELSADEERYAQYLEWHRQPLDPRFIARVKEQRLPAMYRVGQLLRERRALGASAALHGPRAQPTQSPV